MKLPIFDECMFWIADAACQYHANDTDSGAYEAWCEVYSHLWYVNDLLGGAL